MISMNTCILEFVKIWLFVWIKIDLAQYSVKTKYHTKFAL